MNTFGNSPRPSIRLTNVRIYRSSSNTGGRTSSGSGVSPSYAGGRYYAGGASVPYSAGARSPLGVSPFLFPAAGLGFLGGAYLYGAYAYPFSHPYYYHNAHNGTNTSVPVTCLCQQYSECGCDDNGNTTYYDSVIGNGTTPTNSSQVKYVTFNNGSSQVYINGTLDNGTTASGGTTSSSTSGAIKAVAEFSGYWTMIATVIATVMLY